jgi:hypothetical protein
VDSLASLLAVAVVGARALGFYDRSLNRELARMPRPTELTQAIQARGKFATKIGGETNRVPHRRIIKTSLAQSMEIVMVLAAALALGAAASGVFLLPIRISLRALKRPRAT